MQVENLTPLDIGIIIGCFAVTVIVGVLFTRRASRNLNAYFLGSRRIPWPLLSISNASGMFDVAGILSLTALLFGFGVKSIWLTWLTTGFIQACLMVYLAIWLRRSHVLTGAEWMATRFGDRLGGRLAQITVAVFALTSLLALLAYTFQTLGQFAVTFLPWNFSADQYAVFFFAVTTFYVVLGGFYGVVFSGIIRFAIITAASISIAVFAMIKTTPEAINAAVPQGWTTLFNTNLDLDWSQTIGALTGSSSKEGFSMFRLLFVMIAFKALFSGLAGPTPNQNMQRVLAAHTPKKSALMSCFTSVFLLLPRYLLIGSITVLALVFFSTPLASMGPDIDFDRLLPWLTEHHIPLGLQGLLIAAFIAVFMSTLDSSLNAGAAYFVNDVCKKYIVRNATSRTYVAIAYISTIAIALIGIYLGLLGESIQKTSEWLLAGLAAGYVAPNILKWHWWRFNGYGYFAGMITAVAIAVACPAIQACIPAIENLHPVCLFPAILLISTLTSIIASLVTPPDDDQTLKSFYSNVRPWGLWHPIHLKVLRTNPIFGADSSFSRDITNVIVAVVWQTTLAIIPLALIIRQYKMLSIAFATMLITSIFLKINWFDKLSSD